MSNNLNDLLPYSVDWAREKSPELIALLEQSIEQDNSKQDFTLWPGAVPLNSGDISIYGSVDFTERAVPSMRIGDDIDSSLYVIDQYAHTQLMARVGTHMFGKSLGADLQWDINTAKNNNVRMANQSFLNTLMREEAEDGLKLLVRTYLNRVRAVLSMNYAPVNNTRILAVMADALAERDLGGFMDVRVKGSVTPDDLYMTSGLTTMDKDGMSVDVGVKVTNNETGRASVGVYGWLRENRYGSGIALTGESLKVRIVHRGDVNRVAEAVNVALNNAVSLATEGLTRLPLAQRIDHGLGFLRIIEKVVEKEKWRSDLVSSIARLGADAGGNTEYGVIMGIARAAMNEDSEQRALDMQVVAGTRLLEVAV